MRDIGKPEQRISVEDVASEGKAVLRKGGSSNDERDMIRMGKKQELRVSPHRAVLRIEVWLTFGSATSNSSESLVLLQSFSRRGSAR